MGNALSAVLCAARAMQQEARLILRIEDLDGPRVMPGAADSIIGDLHRLGLRFVHEGPVRSEAALSSIMFQSTRSAAYDEALSSLSDRNLVYACRCSRKDLARIPSAPHVGEEGPPYPGTCRTLALPLETPDTALRLKMDAATAVVGDPVVVDRICGPCTGNLVEDVGDIVLRRKDGLYAYQLAVVVDDAAQGVTEVTRARDLKSSATRQALLHLLLGHQPPAFAHLPILVDSDGRRLSKRTPQAPALLGPLLDTHGASTIIGHLLWLFGLGPKGGHATINDVAAAITTDVLAQHDTIAWQPLP